MKVLQTNESLIHVFHEVVARSSDRIALEYMNKSYTYRDLKAATDSVAARLLKAGMQPGISLVFI